MSNSAEVWLPLWTTSACAALPDRHHLLFFLAGAFRGDDPAGAADAAGRPVSVRDLHKLFTSMASSGVLLPHSIRRRGKFPGADA